MQCISCASEWLTCVYFSTAAAATATAVIVPFMVEYLLWVRDSDCKGGKGERGALYF